MSNLLNTNKKNILKRTPRIEPTETFKLEEDVPTIKVEQTEVDPPATTKKVEEVEKKEEIEVAKKPKAKTKRKTNEEITSVRVTKDTRARINALIQLGRAESADALLDAIVDEYIALQLAPSEKKTFDILVKVNRKN